MDQIKFKNKYSYYHEYLNAKTTSVFCRNICYHRYFINQ